MTKFLTVLIAIGIISGCTEAPVQQAKTEAETSTIHNHLNNDDLYVVYQEGRMNIFYDAKLYKGFLEIGETPFRKTFIGIGPKGETIMYGLTKKDKKKLTGIPSLEMMEGRMKPADNFYGEIRKDGRINVFNNWELFKKYLAHGEVPYRLTDIGAGPKGETVVYALTKETKKKRPEDLMTKFKAFYAH